MKKTVLFRIYTTFLLLAAFSLAADDIPKRYDRNPYSHVSRFYVDEIEREHGEIVIEFNIPVNPDSVTPQSIRINSQDLPPEAKIRYNRKGDKITVWEIPEWINRKICIEISGLRSYNNIPMEKLPPLHLKDDDEFERDDWDECEWCEH